MKRKIDKISEIHKSDETTRVPDNLVKDIISAKCTKCANYHPKENKCYSFEIANDILTSCIKLEFYNPIKKDVNKDEFRLLDYQWLHCHNCNFYDGYDVCLKFGNFGTIVDETIDNCKKQNYIKNKYFNESPQH